MKFTFLQSFFLMALIFGVVGVFFSMLLLTWALISPKAKITTRTAGKWIIICFFIVTLGYMAMVMVS